MREFSDQTWALLGDIDALIVQAHTYVIQRSRFSHSHRLLCQGQECMRNDLDLVLRPQVVLRTSVEA